MKLKNLLFVAVLTMAYINTSAQVSWYLQAGGIWGKGDQGYYKPGDYTYMSEREWNEEDYGHKGINSGFEVSAGLYMMIPLKRNKMFLDTGLGWRLKNTVSVRNLNYGGSYDDPDYYKFLNFQGNMNFLELPVRFGYQLNLNAKNSFQFKLGPYISCALGEIHDDIPNNFSSNMIPDELYPISVGLSPSIMYKHRAFSVGATLNTPCFYNGLRATKGTSFNLVISINLGSTSHWDWDAIASGLEAAGGAMQSVSDSYAQMKSGGTNDSGSVSAGSYGSTRSGNASSGGKYDVNEQKKRNQDRKIYEKYDSQLSMHFSGNRTMSSSSVRDAQKKMRDLRQKWEAKGYSFPKSANEDR